MKENGFTLIELLAVIVILAIIALIATPIVLDIIEDSKESSTKRSAELYLNGVEQAIARYQLNGKEVTSGTYYVMENGNICTSELVNKECTGEEITVTVDGTKPSSGTITINKGEIESINNLYIDKKYINKKDNEIVLSDEEYVEPICKAKTTVTTGNLAQGNYNYGDEYTCNVGDGEEKTFYVLEDGDTTTLTEGRIAQPGEVSLIMNMNIDRNGKGTTEVYQIAWCKSGNDNSCAADGAIEYLKNSTTNWTKLNESQISLPSAYQIDIASGDTTWPNKNDNIPDLSAWLYENINTFNTSYWTSTPEFGQCAWVVNNDGFISSLLADNTYFNSGIRPVITISKSQLG